MSRLLTLQQKLPQKSQQGQEILSFEKCIPTATRISEFRGIVDENLINFAHFFIEIDMHTV